jgi:hypothetical protein
MSYQSYTGGRSYNFVKNIDEVITLLDKIDEVITSSKKIDDVITSSCKYDEVITLSQKNCRSYFLQKQFTKPIISYYCVQSRVKYLVIYIFLTNNTCNIIY